jgi:hypothetical protein
VTDNWPAPERDLVEIDTSTAHPARVYDVWLGGKNNFAVDREAAALSVAANPEIMPSVRANRAFLGRSVRHLVDAGIRQFLDIGTGIPAENNVHEVAQRAAPESRVVYVDNDPIVLAHARRLLRGAPEGATSYIHGDLHEPETILAEAAATLDLDRPVGLMLFAIAQYISDADDPYAIVTRLLDAFPAGSHLVISHPASDINVDQVATSMQKYNERAAVHATPRTHGQVTRFFTGLDLLPPGVVTLNEWHPDDATPHHPAPLPMWCGVAKKP